MAQYGICMHWFSVSHLHIGCADKVLGSDHRPVFASFNVGVTSDFVMNRNSLTSESLIKIVFHQVVAQVSRNALDVGNDELSNVLKYYLSTM